jgi:hypothetical protein
MPHPMNKGQGKRAGQLAMNRSKQADMVIRATLALLVVLALTSVRLAEAQQSAKVPRIGYLSAASLAVSSPQAEAFRKG